MSAATSRSVRSLSVTGAIPDAALGALPGLSPEAIDARRVAVGAGVALDPIEAVHRNEQARVVGVLDAKEFPLDAAQLERILESRNIINPGGQVRTPYEEIVFEPSGNFESVEELRRSVIGLPGGELLTLHMGPEFILVTMNLDFDDALDATQVERVTAELDAEIKGCFPRVKRVFIEAQSLARPAAQAGEDSEEEA